MAKKKKVSTVKVPNHGPTLTENGNNCAGSRGPSRSPNRRDDYLQNPSPQKASARSKKGSSPQHITPPKLGNTAVAGGQRDVIKQTAKLLHQNKYRDELSPMRHEKKKESHDANGNITTDKLFTGKNILKDGGQGIKIEKKTIIVSLTSHAEWGQAWAQQNMCGKSSKDIRSSKTLSITRISCGEGLEVVESSEDASSVGTPGETLRGETSGNPANLDRDPNGVSTHCGWMSQYQHEDEQGYHRRR